MSRNTVSVWGLGFRVQGLGFRVSGSITGARRINIRVSGLGIRVLPNPENLLEVSRKLPERAILSICQDISESFQDSQFRNSRAKSRPLSPPPPCFTV